MRPDGRETRYDYDRAGLPCRENIDAFSERRVEHFHDAILLAANLGDDADSVAATAGQLAGALYGYSGIPDDWLAKLAQRERISQLAERLFELSPD